ncbi:DUF6880 family protein [Azohydromonas aeria]|uniref:DUF6880 family protein n=1 Tax=Azohydromonas aeria TaxID=2590212 RepID=UPI0012F8559E|nr:DUF6880 family protein [Azohydromonas aeria]
MDQHDDGLEAFLRDQDADVLASVLLELAQDYDVVARRLSRLRLANQPALVASQFREILARWRRDDKYLKFPESSHFGTELEIWLEQVERELMATDPSAVLELAEAFIEADADFFERVDDSYGDIGRAMEAACGLWLCAASRCKTPAGGWLTRLMELLSQDNYGGRHALLRDAGKLLDQSDVSRLDERLY